MIDDIEIIEDVPKEINFNFKSYFTLTIIIAILAILQIIITSSNIFNDYMSTLLLFKTSKIISLIGPILLIISSMVIFTNLTQKPKIAGICGIIIGIVGFFTLPIISEIIGVLLLIDGLRLIINS